jgi:alpha-glucosidase
LLALALPGSVYIYQGEELGLPEVEDIPADRRQDPMFFRSGGLDPGRDGCRVPLPWSDAAPPYGFSPPDSAQQPWLDQPADWSGLTVAAQTAAPGSTLRLYRDAIRIRRAEASLGGGTLRWLAAGPTVLAFDRGVDITCIVNFGPDRVALPADADVLLASGPLEEGQLPVDTTAWLRLSREKSPSPVEKESR